VICYTKKRFDDVFIYLGENIERWSGFVFKVVSFFIPVWFFGLSAFDLL